MFCVVESSFSQVTEELESFEESEVFEARVKVSFI